MELPTKKIYKWKNEICTLLNYSVILPNFAYYRFFSLFLVGDQHCRLLRTYYEVNCCCIISYTPHAYHNAWQYHGSYKNSAGSLLCYLDMLSKTICTSLKKLSPFIWSTLSIIPMEIKAHQLVPSFLGVSVSEKFGPSELFRAMISVDS